jgi:hypothetical protein
MATYKVIQDVEAEDKLVGPLSLRQFIYAGIAALSGYLGFLLTTKHAAFMLAIFVPITLICGFFAFPWGQDQPTEVWALAKIRFMLKPRRRVWDQSGAKELVTVTAPKRIERHLTNGLNQDEIRSRLSALANTIDSRGWAVKNVNVNLSPASMLPDTSDRLVSVSSLPQEVTTIDVRASDDMLDPMANPIAQQFDSMINASATAHRQQLVAQIQTNDSTQDHRQQPPADYWFMHQGPTVPGQATFVDASVVSPGADSNAPAIPHAAAPTPEEEALVAKFKSENHSLSAAYGHMKTVKTPEQLAEEARAAAANAKQAVTPEKQAAIMNLASIDDQSVATIARRAHEEVGGSDDEVVVSLH